MKLSIPNLTIAAGLLAGVLASTGASATTVSLTLSDVSSRAQEGLLTFHSDVNQGPSASTNKIFIGSYQMTSGEWVYCVSPFTTALTTGNYEPVTLDNFFGANGGYVQQFQQSTPDYLGLAPGYDNRDPSTVMNKIVALYSYAYDDTLQASGNVSVAEKSAAFAYALWEIKGEGGAYSTATGGLRLNGSAGSNVDVTSYANTLLSNVSSGVWTGFSMRNYEFTVYQATPLSSSQSFLVARELPNNRNQVPEPSTLLLLAASTAGLLMARRQTQRR